MMTEGTATDICIDISQVVALCDKLAPLVQGYPPKPAFIQIDQNGAVTAVVSDKDSGSDYVLDGATMRWRVPSTISGGDLRDFIVRRDVLELLKRIHAGRMVKQSKAAIKARLNQEAKAANNELKKLFRKLAKDAYCVELRDANDWLRNTKLSTVWPKDYTLKNALEEINWRLRWAKFVVAGDIRSALLKRVLEAFDAGSDEIYAVHARALLKAGMIDQAKYDDWLAKRSTKRSKNPVEPVHA